MQKLDICKPFQLHELAIECETLYEDAYIGVHFYKIIVIYSIHILSFNTLTNYYLIISILCILYIVLSL
jgi:hypothetical protein